MADEKEIAYWDWRSEDPPCMGIQIQSPEGIVYPLEEQLTLIDTGYSGGILLPKQIYRRLHLHKWEYPDPEIYIMANEKEIKTIQARGYIIVPRLSSELIEVKIDTPKEEDTKDILLGCEFIRQFKLLLNGLNGKVCII
ncbi:MAG: hypothetical protein IB616_02655 [Methanosarcinales archaeon]|nr:MAG: hypothetical protein IB616_02655 [Methanosarcinales archaeon]